VLRSEGVRRVGRKRERRDIDESRGERASFGGVRGGQEESEGRKKTAESMLLFERVRGWAGRRREERRTRAEERRAEGKGPIEPPHT
jgi:hypothetical protein